MRLLLIENNRQIRALVHAAFPFVFSLDTVSTPAEAAHLFARRRFDTVIICRKEILTQFFHYHVRSPVLFLPLSSLTAKFVLLPHSERSLHFGSLTVFIDQKSASSHSVPLRLRKKEFELLQKLIQHPQITLKYTYLMQSIWNSWHRPQLTTLQRHVASLRRELRRCHASVQITTQHGIGYRLDLL